MARVSGSHFHRWAAVLLVALPVLQGVNLALVSDLDARKMISNLFQTMAAAVVAVAMIRAARQLQRGGSESATGWFYIAVAACFWAAGMTAFMFVEVVLGLRPYPGVPDVFFLLFYPAMLIGLWRLPREPVTRRELWNNVLDVGAMAVVASLVIWQFNLRLLLESLATKPNSGTVVSLGYTLADTLLLLLIFSRLVGRLGRGRQFVPVLLLVIGCFFQITADLLQGYVTTYSSFTNGSPIDLAWVLFSACTGLAALDLLRHGEEVEADSQAGARIEMFRTIWTLAITYLWIAMVLVLLIWAVFHRQEIHAGLLVLGVLAATLLAIIRQVRTLRENVRLYQELRESAARLDVKVQERTAELHQQTERLRLSEAKFRGIVETTREWLWVTDATGQHTYCNPAIERILGYPLPEFQRLGLSLLHPEDREQVEGLLVERTRRKEGWTGLVLRWRHRDGSYRFLESNAIVLLDPQGAVVGFQGADRDITDKRRLEQQYLRAQRLESVGTLASGVAHDLNNILSPIIMGVDMLNLNAVDAETRTMLRTMKESARRGADTIKQLLTFARGSDSLKGPVQPRHLLKEFARLLQQTFPKNIRIHTEYAGPSSTVLADPSQLHQVLMNLCVNARDAMPDGGMLSIRLENQPAEESTTILHPKARPIRYAVFRVADTGTGIPPEILDRIFDPFFTTKPQGRGTGLGLATVLGIVENHGGFVLVDSKSGQGTTFQVYLPASAEDEDDGATVESPALPRGQGELVLVVDDELAILRLAEGVLRRNGYMVLTASSATAGLLLFEENRNRVRVVLTDIMMPFGDGRQLIAALAERDPRLPVIAISGLATAEFQYEALKRGAKAFLAKPFTAEQVLAALHHLLPSRGTGPEVTP